MARLIRTALLVSSLALAASACGDGGDDGAGGGGAGGGGEGGLGGELLDTDPFAPGLTRAGDAGRFWVRLVAADPAKLVKGDNSITFEVLDATTQAPLSDVGVVLEPVMIAHGHGTTPPRFTASVAEGGLYRVGPFALFMPGVWECRFHLLRGEDEADELAFRFRIEG